MACKHEWKQVLRIWDGCTRTDENKFYCIKCLKITPTQQQLEDKGLTFEQWVFEQ